MTCPPPTMRHLAQSLCALLLLSLAAAQQTEAEAPLSSFLAALESHPELLAAQAAVQAAELQLRAARDPVALEATGGYSRVDLKGGLTGPTLSPGLSPAQAPTNPGTGAPGSSTVAESGWQLRATLVFRPYPFGDVADLVAQRELELQTSLLELRSAQAGLEARALEAALQARLAERSAAIAQESVSTALQGLRATRLRGAKGAANDRELRNAETAVFEAQTLRQNAELDVQTARLNLQSLVGTAAPPPSYATLTGLAAPARSTPASVSQTLLQTRQTDLAIGAAQRELLPVASANYAWNASDTSTVTASVESRTLQPSVGFTYQEPGRTLPTSAIEGTLSLGVSANISVGAIDALAAAERQRAAAQAGLAAARQGGALQETALRSAYTKAVRDAELSRRGFANANTTYQENRTREDLGLSAPLETQTSLLELLQADLKRRSGELASLSALLDLYELYALPPSETLP